MLYQLSYFRKFRFSVPRRAVSAKIYRIGATPLVRRRFAATSEGFATPTGFLKWEVMDSNHRRRTPADLQSAPFDRSGNFPFFSSEEVSFRRAFQTKAPSSSPIPLSRVPKLIRPSSFPLLQPRTSPALSLGPLASAFRADGGIRTPDQLITNQLLWPTELHRHFTTVLDYKSRYKKFNNQIFGRKFSTCFKEPVRTDAQTESNRMQR